MNKKNILYLFLNVFLSVNNFFIFIVQLMKFERLVNEYNTIETKVKEFYPAILGEIKARGIKVVYVSKQLNLNSNSTFYRKIKKYDFTGAELNKLVEILK